ncbi:MAG TPA: transcription termination/antitermination NusG family protein [Candidatus Binatia bacterium]|nr:transcription termination/antitermination NusG family protein [Candidatus Binatia bacterium]
MSAIEATNNVAPNSRTAWYVVQTKRHRERAALQHLEERGIGSYLPQILQWPRPAVGSPVVAMFPGYLFVRCSMPDGFARVGWTPGVKAFVSLGGVIASVEDQVIECLREREGADGLIRYNNGIEINGEVRIVRGPFRGLNAVLEERLPARERVRVLMDLLQRSTLVELPERWIVRA